MGTKVQCKSYLPEYCSPRDLNTDTNNAWPICYDDMAPSGQFYNCFTQRSLTRYSGYDKEALRQTMLKHEATFRMQVSELHRLYRIQRDLMNGLKRKDQYGFLSNVQPSQSSTVSSHKPSRDSLDNLQAPRFPLINSSSSRPSVTSTDDSRCPLKLLDSSSIHDSPKPTQSSCGSLRNGELLESQIRKCSRVMIDLQLPADVYIDNEDVERENGKLPDRASVGATDYSSLNGDFKPNDARLSLSTAECSSGRGEFRMPDSGVQSDPNSHSLTNLNEPVKEICYKNTSLLSLSNFPDSKPIHETNQAHQLHLESDSSFQNWQKDFLPDTHSKQGTCSVFPVADKEETREKWSFLRDETGQSSFDKKVLAEPEPENFKLLRSLDPLFSMCNQRETNSWLSEKANNSNELFARMYLSSTSFAGQYSVPLNSNHGGETSLSASSWMKLTDSSDDQVFPSTAPNIRNRSCGSSIKCSSNATDKWKFGDSTPYWCFGREPFSYPNGFRHDLQPESGIPSHAQLPAISFDKPNLNDSESFPYFRRKGHENKSCVNGYHRINEKYAKDINLNVTLPNGFSDGIFIPNTAVGISEGNNESSWLRSSLHCNGFVDLNKTADNNLGLEHDYSKDVPTHGAAPRELYRTKETGTSSFLDVLQAGARKKEASSFPSTKKNHETSVNEKQGTLSSSLEDPAIGSAKDRFYFADTSARVNFLDLEEQISEDPVNKGRFVENACDFRGIINLNSSATSTDQQKPSEVLSDAETQVPSLHMASNVAKSSFLIDLEIPADPLPEEHMFSARETTGANITIPENFTVCQQENKLSQDPNTKVAAEIILSMSSDIYQQADAPSHLPSDVVPDDTLRWFADLVSSNAGDSQKVAGKSKEDSSSDHDSLDFFEAMTLKLTEIKFDDCLHRPPELETQNDKETNFAALLLTKPRRGQARKRRQRRDFQKDILPGLASLSRNEVTEDLQTIGGMMKASGQNWQAGMTRRNSGRSGGNGQPRGRRRGRGAAVTAPVAEAPVEPPSRQHPDGTEDIDARCIMGWGRTRRCRRPRHPQGNIAPFLA